MTNQLIVVVTALEKAGKAINANFYFEGIIAIKDLQGRKARLNYSAKKQKGFISELSIAKNDNFGTMPVSLKNEVSGLMLKSMNDLKNKRPESLKKNGIAVNKFFEIQNNQWTKFIEPNRHEEKVSSMPIQRKPILSKP